MLRRDLVDNRNRGFDISHLERLTCPDYEINFHFSIAAIIVVLDFLSRSWVLKVTDASAKIPNFGENLEF